MSNSLLMNQEVATQYNLASEENAESPVNFQQKHHYSKAELTSCADGKLFGPGNAQLPSGPLLLLDEITDIQNTGGNFKKGYAKAAIHVEPDAWYFNHHFKNDPVFPGSLMLEAIWQLTGFHLAWTSLPGRGRLIDSGKSRFHASVSNNRQLLELEIHIKKLIRKPGIVGVACGAVYAGDEIICTTENLKIALVKPG